MMDSRDQLARESAGGTKTINVKPAMQRFLHAVAAAGGPLIYMLKPDSGRRVPDPEEAGPVKTSAADVDMRTLPVGPTGSTRIVVVRPSGVRKRLPVVMYFHGADWILGSVDKYQDLARDIAQSAQVAVVLVDYDRLLGSPHPVAFDEAYEATRYVADHAEEFNVDAARLAIAGDGVGTNMVAAVSMFAEERCGPPIRFRLLFYAVTGDTLHEHPHNEFAKGQWLTRYIMKWYWPLWASFERLEAQPPALIVTDEDDVLPDETEADSSTLALSGVTVTGIRSLGDAHDYSVLNGLTDKPVTRGAIALASAMLRQELCKQHDQGCRRHHHRPAMLHWASPG
jgi:acetyl esterase